ncbi:hypothetical protein AB1Y20_007057 [Prymnesium parvum]|uniref:Endonuclease/exonuclease/phosphatase domain-containing protein n=1 Tax=Prymnesium parvum TaxID=97485 RepID=A0AB34J2K1_PRYPA|eukprot:CAMPEP_0184395120 /NCGR_PEP_ID=MMETSP0007-20130409/42757_1 /TAXON_ID=97485 /ORGANISM="Prymnesium parvum, Strain Texoma1" /LENGTH=423 /DNA_ID=CAMNT_0026747083 /DNA_START=33 /DNA_END=1304 /DNA_ORIENTATION=+
MPSKPKKKKAQPDPRGYATTSLPKARQPEEPSLAAPVEEDLAVPSGAGLEAQTSVEPIAVSDAASMPATAMPSELQGAAPAPPPAPHPLRRDWKQWPTAPGSDDERHLSKRLLQCETTLGVVASVHLAKVDMKQGMQMRTARDIYSWIFDAHHVVMGDMNCVWSSMIGGAPLDFSHGKPKSKSSGETEAWVKPERHAMATRTGGTYLPEIATEKQPRWPGDRVSIDPPAFDLVVVSLPMQVTALLKQPGKAFQSAKLPRKLIETLDWPSDHTSVVAEVKVARSSAITMTVATWNVADPFYFSKFWPGASLGFERRAEAARILSIERHVQKLLDVADVVGLQEVPVQLVQQLVRNAMSHSKSFHAQWVAAPSTEDMEWKLAAGQRGDSSTVLPTTLPPVAHDMLFCRDSILKRSVISAKPETGS